jgi:IstB-like ATP binding protein
VTATTPPPLAADLTEGLKRLKMAAMRQLAPELLVTAKTQRWNPEEFLRTLVEAEITARDASNARNRRRQAAFPVTKTLEEFDLAPLHPHRDVRLPRLPRVGPGRGERLPDRTRRHRQEPRPGGAGDRRGRGRAPGPLLHRRRPRRDPLPRPGRQQRREGHRHPAPQTTSSSSTDSASLH